MVRLGEGKKNMVGRRKRKRNKGYGFLGEWIREENEGIIIILLVLFR